MTLWRFQTLFVTSKMVAAAVGGRRRFKRSNCTQAGIQCRKNFCMRAIGHVFALYARIRRISTLSRPWLTNPASMYGLLLNQDFFGGVWSMMK
jgi:hypothetical protein